MKLFCSCNNISENADRKDSLKHFKSIIKHLSTLYTLNNLNYNTFDWIFLNLWYVHFHFPCNIYFSELFFLKYFLLNTVYQFWLPDLF